MRTIWEDFVVALQEQGFYVQASTYSIREGGESFILGSAHIMRNVDGPKPVRIKCAKCDGYYLVLHGTPVENVAGLCSGCGGEG